MADTAGTEHQKVQCGQELQRATCVVVRSVRRRDQRRAGGSGDMQEPRTGRSRAQRVVRQREGVRVDAVIDSDSDDEVDDGG